jgi:hypothetical protein
MAKIEFLIGFKEERRNTLLGHNNDWRLKTSSRNFKILEDG